MSKGPFVNMFLRTKDANFVMLFTFYSWQTIYLSIRLPIIKFVLNVNSLLKVLPGLLVSPLESLITCHLQHGTLYRWIFPPVTWIHSNQWTNKYWLVVMTYVVTSRVIKHYRAWTLRSSSTIKIFFIYLLFSDMLKDMNLCGSNWIWSTQLDFKS